MTPLAAGTSVDRYTLAQYAIGVLQFLLLVALIGLVGMLVRRAWASRHRAAAAVDYWLGRAMGEHDDPDARTLGRW